MMKQGVLDTKRPRRQPGPRKGNMLWSNKLFLNTPVETARQAHWVLARLESIPSAIPNVALWAAWI